jgi:elongation factor G
VDYLPSPLDMPAVVGCKSGDKDKPLEVVCDPKKPLVALAFKITADKHGDLYFLRIYQGTLKKGSRVFNSTRDRKENVTRIFQMHANNRLLLDEAQAGDIVAVVGLKDTLTGDTLCDTHSSVVLESIRFRRRSSACRLNPSPEQIVPGWARR